MALSAFNDMYLAIGDSLDAAYDKILTDLFESPTWNSGPVPHRRILWTNGRKARAEDREAFRSPGLYFWGIEQRPLYIGITCGSFDKRFNRYIWGRRSQCNLAHDFEASIKTNGINGFSSEIIEWYARQHPGSTIRLRGAVRFANEGVASIWFALFPHGTTTEIEQLERAIIPVANAWNLRCGLRPLLNVEFNREGSTC